MSAGTEKKRAPRNRTITLMESELQHYGERLLHVENAAQPEDILDRTICQDVHDVVGRLPSGFVDMMFIDPPYNMDKTFNRRSFKKQSHEEYVAWVEGWLPPLAKVLKETASIYICADWRCSSAIEAVAEKHFTIRNRITWEREKGRGATRNWKNCSEDIWFCTASDDYTFNVDAVKLRRSVIAPYTTENGDPKDWERTSGGNFRLTHPSNLWTDLTVPFWSMPENTDHPTQKPEKLLAKIILASSNEGDVVFDPFLGSGTTSVVAKKLGRRYCGVEIDETFACLAEKRLAEVETNQSIQGYRDGVFWERNALADKKLGRTKATTSNHSAKQAQMSLFDDDSTSRTKERRVDGE